MICASRHVLLECSDGIGGLRVMHRVGEKCIQGFGWKTGRQEVTSNTEGSMGT
jgi:hypothetical protein